MSFALTQIKAPAIMERYVQRPRLARLMRGHGDTKLIFISAPPGYGKTALIGAFTNIEASQGRKCTWVTMGVNDDHPARFWNLLVAAFKTCEPKARIDLPGDSGQNAYDTVASIINHIALQPNSSHLLVIDNYQHASSAELNEQMKTLVYNAPPNMTVLIASNRSLTFPASKLRMNDEIVEIYADDLRFRLDEAEYYLNDCSHLDLPPDKVKSIYRAVRGWPAGLRMASIAVERGGSNSDVIASLENMRTSFFMDTVVSQKSDEMQQFLMRVSGLPRMSPLLAEHVSEMQQTGALLAELEQDELFAEVSSEQPPWYAFSKTFRDALHRNALKTLPPDTIRALHQRASEWLQANGDYMLAIDFAIKADRPAVAAAIVADNLYAVMSQTQGDNLARHLEAMNHKAHAPSPSLAMAAAWAYCAAGQPRQALHWTDLARSAGVPDTCSHELVLGTVEACAHSMLGDFSASLEQATSMLERMNERGSPSSLSSLPWLHLTLRHVVGESCMRLGRFNEASEHLAYCIDMASSSGRNVIQYLAACELSELHTTFGRFAEAEQVARSTLRLQRKNLTEPPWSVALLQMQLATLLMYDGRLKEANDLAARARRRLGDQANADGRLCLIYLEGQLALCHGNRDVASQLFGEALTTARDNVVPRGKSATVCALSAMHLIAMDSHPEAIATMEHILAIPVSTDPHLATIVNLVCAAFSLFNGLPEETLRRATDTLDSCRKHGFVLLGAHAFLLEALALSALKDQRGATMALLEAARLLEPSNVTYPIVASGFRMGVLVGHALDYCANASYAFRRGNEREIAFLRKCKALTSRDSETKRTCTDLGLTAREQQVYCLLQAGRSRREIASGLGISYNTVRVHVSNIYKKTLPSSDTGT